jgi:hypothetical protein
MLRPRRFACQLTNVACHGGRVSWISIPCIAQRRFIPRILAIVSMLIVRTTLAFAAQF